mgnify:CR=1 FL=1
MRRTKEVEGGRGWWVRGEKRRFEGCALCERVRGGEGGRRVENGSSRDARTWNGRSPEDDGVPPRRLSNATWRDTGRTYGSGRRLKNERKRRRSSVRHVLPLSSPPPPPPSPPCRRCPCLPTGFRQSASNPLINHPRVENARTSEISPRFARTPCVGFDEVFSSGSEVISTRGRYRVECLGFLSLGWLLAARGREI